MDFVAGCFVRMSWENAKKSWKKILSRILQKSYYYCTSVCAGRVAIEENLMDSKSEIDKVAVTGEPPAKQQEVSKIGSD